MEKHGQQGYNIKQNLYSSGVWQKRGIPMKYIYECRILLIDDHAQLREMVCNMLHKEGFPYIDTAADCAGALLYLSGQQPDIIILDVGLPDGDGFSLMQKIRTLSDIPVLFLSARDEDNDRLLGLGLGADDYITKPFLPKELILRLTAILKRTYFSPNRPEPAEEHRLVLGNKTVHFDSAVIQEQDGRELPLTAKELALLKKLGENRGKIVTFDTLTQAVWGDYYFGYENTLMVHIRRLREKIEENPSNPKWLLTVRGIGYKLAKE